jgi:hypothetical protein
MKIVLKVAGSCSLAETYRRFRGASCLALIIEAASSSVTSVEFYQSTRRSNPEGSDPHTHAVRT